MCCPPSLNGGEEEALERIRQRAREAQFQADFEDCQDIVFDAWEKANGGRPATPEEFLELLDAIEDCLIDRGWPPGSRP